MGEGGLSIHTNSSWLKWKVSLISLLPLTRWTDEEIRSQEKWVVLMLQVIYWIGNGLLESGVRHAKMSHGEVDCMRKIGRKVRDENVAR